MLGEDSDEFAQARSPIRILTTCTHILDSQGGTVSYSDNEDSDQTARMYEKTAYFILPDVLRMISDHNEI